MTTILRTRARRLILTGILAAGLGAGAVGMAEAATASTPTHPTTATSSAPARTHSAHGPMSAPPMGNHCHHG